MTLDILRNFIQSSNINFLYGSGISRPYLSTLGNIEKWLTKVAEDDGKETYKDVIKASLYKAYCDGVILKNHYFYHDKDFLETKSAYTDFFSVCNELMNKRNAQLLNKQINLFTTNIDLLAEETLEKSGIELNDGFRGTLKPAYNESNFQISLSKSSMQFHKQAEVPMFNLIKVHGAVNWKEQDGTIRSDTMLMYYVQQALDKIDKDYFVNLYKTNGTEKTYDEVKTEADDIALHLPDNAYDKFFDAYNQIVMINPTKDKFRTSVLDYHFYELMRIYSNALERENSLLFVMGFSFADEHIAQITKRAADTNPTLQVVVFAYSDKDLDTYKQNLGIEHGCSNNNILILTPSSFKESNQDKYKELCELVENFNLKTINLLFKEISKNIHSGYGTK
ncbi:hypothetical protein DW060_11595 [Leyella stercorea]|uniref:Uncharacterized protein n=1 Tax=Leyella stercorea TaxID=363265 RepID=A0A415GFJ8_9BACT|nr:hypothetical protein DW060_11595 [Leyella stercorea]